jgi:hypothetical protein
MYNVIDCLFSHFHMFHCAIHSPEDEHMKDRNILGLYEVRVRNVLFGSVNNNWSKAVQWWNK